MLKFLKGFFFLIILYHVLVTIVCYGLLGGQYPQLPSLIRDGLRIGFFLLMFFVYWKDWKNYFRTRKYPWLIFFFMLIWGVIVSSSLDKSLSDVLVGIKYGFFYMFTFLSASFLGFLGKIKLGRINILKAGGYLLIGIAMVGFLWQIAKLIWPDFFMRMGYGPLNDFFFGKNPPIYYLTGYQGTLRRQGLFAGPNNYGYFLVAFLPLILLLFGRKLKKRKDLMRLNKESIINGFIILIWGLAIVFTLSRTAILGGAIVLVLLNIGRIKSNKRKAWGLAILLIIALVGLSGLKGTSTLGHIYAKFSSINRAIQHPMGMGLGTSGPAIHHNGSILPENYFIQILIDIGTIGFILWAAVRYRIMLIEKSIKKERGNKIQNEGVWSYLLRKALHIGRLALLVMGLFLHVFEDSMVNYMFFVLYGMITGYLTNHDKPTNL